jgi:protein MAK11
MTSTSNNLHAHFADLDLAHTAMGQKRKREATTLQAGAPNGKTRKIAAAKPAPPQSHISIIVGSYEKVLHGIIATLPQQILEPDTAAKHVPITEGKGNINGQEQHGTNDNEEKQEQQKTAPTPTSEDDSLQITFADSFLFTAHNSAIRCMTLSPLPSASDTSQKLLLATGANDERINLYNLSTTPPPLPKKGPIPLAPPPSLSGVKVSQNALNKELGALDHHNGPITRLIFPTKSKLLTAAEDNTISISRTRDWTVLSTIKAPVPKPLGRPSGDTAAPSEVPAGVNDIAIHPSMKLMLSVGKGEKCMRLWNLVTGKKAGVLSFERDVLQAVGEGKYGTGEGRRILWDEAGEEFVVGFERGAVVFDVECNVKGVLVPRPQSKIHQMWYVPGLEANVLAVSTEDGRVLFFETEGAVVGGEQEEAEGAKKKKEQTIPECRLIAQMGGRVLGVSSRIKDFTILSARSGTSDSTDAPSSTSSSLVFVTGSSDGTVRLWSLSTTELEIAQEAAIDATEEKGKVPQVGHLLAQYETGNRVTCLTAFVMNERQEGAAEPEAGGDDGEFGGFSDAEENGGDGAGEGSEEDEDEEDSEDSDESD